MKIEQKNHSKMEDDFKQMTKSFKSDLRKAAEKTVKAQKAKKGKDAQVRVYECLYIYMFRNLNILLIQSRSHSSTQPIFIVTHAYVDAHRV